MLPGFGEISQRRISAARVLVIGAGGLGCASVPYLAGCGVGTIGIIDDDVVELSNLHRQVAHRTEDLGHKKVTSLADRAREIDPSLHVIEHDLRLTSTNAMELFSGYDLVIDGSDNYPTRYLANDAAALSEIPLVWGAILAHHGQVGVAWHKHGPDYRDLFPSPPDPTEVVTCASGGVLPGLCGTVGSLLATEALKLITGIGEPLIGRVLVYDALKAATRELRYERDPLATPVTGLIDYELFCAGPSAPTGITAAQLVRMIESGTPLRLLDVRGTEERRELRITVSEPLPLPVIEAEHLAGSITTQVSVGANSASSAGATALMVYCAKGPRSIRAVKLLRGHGIDVCYLVGGIEEFSRAAPHLVTSCDDKL